MPYPLTTNHCKVDEQTYRHTNTQTEPYNLQIYNFASNYREKIKEKFGFLAVKLSLYSIKHLNLQYVGVTSYLAVERHGILL